jgi:hypothetical protein
MARIATRQAAQDQAVAAHPCRRQSLARSQTFSDSLPDICHFGAEFAEYCSGIAPTVPSPLNIL